MERGIGWLWLETFRHYSRSKKSHGSRAGSVNEESSGFSVHTDLVWLRSFKGRV